MADAYNAMTSDRPYRDAMPSRVARLRLAQAVESQFDTSVVAAFEAILADEVRGLPDGKTHPMFQSFANTRTASPELEDETSRATRHDQQRRPSIQHERSTRANADLVVDVMGMNLDRRLSDEEATGDFPVRYPPTAGDKPRSSRFVRSADGSLRPLGLQPISTANPDRRRELRRSEIFPSRGARQQHAEYVRTSAISTDD